MPSSSAVRIVLIPSASSLPPHIQPPIDQVPSPMRELVIPTPQISFRSIGVVASSSSLSMTPAARALHAALTRATESPRNAHPALGHSGQLARLAPWHLVVPALSLGE